ncbi:MAG TPA: metalloregulator ArsR/SmtB family transcription factor [Polyangiales bacterium]|nr:metalloregulator ArsR/SmtB family transcription factor [Polyangiales bacterium]
MTQESTDALFRALGDPTRRALFERLVAGEHSVSALAASFPISQPAISQHLAALRAAGLVAVRKDGRNAFYRVDPKGLTPLVTWVDRYRAFWPAKLDKLKAVLRGMEEP